MKLDLLIRGAKTAVGDTIHVGISNGKIAMLSKDIPGTMALDEIDADGLALLPGVIDPHVHLNWPLSEDPASLIQSESAAAASGGVTTIGHMPLGVKESLVDHLAVLTQQIEERSLVDVAVCFPILSEEHIGQMDELYDLGVTSFKVFRAYRPTDVYNFGGADDALLYLVMEKIVQMRSNGKRALLKVHCENAGLVQLFAERYRAKFPDLGRGQALDDVTWADCRPDIVEAESVNSMVYLAQTTGCPISIVHLSSGLAVDVVRRAKANGAEILIETTPNYLETDDLRTGVQDGPPWTRVQPSVKKSTDAAALWAGVEDGTIDYLGTDHAPAKRENYLGKSVWDEGASGRSLLAISLPIMLDTVARGKLSLPRLVGLMSEGPANIVGLAHRKGKLRIGYDADLVLCDLDSTRVVTADSLNSYGDHTPFQGRSLTGWPVFTIRRGQPVWGPEGQLVESGGHYQSGNGHEVRVGSRKIGLRR